MEPTHPNSSKVRKTRGSTIRGDIPKGAEVIVSFNELGQPIGSGKTDLMSFLGGHVRRNFNITIPTWHQVPRDAKENLWAEVVSRFRLDDAHKALVLSSAAKKFTEFKSLLTCKYILPFLDHPEYLQKPPEIYNWISQESWQEFVESRNTPEFLELRKSKQEARKKNVYAHRMSRKGYAQKRNDLVKDGLLTSENYYDRSVIWKIARQDRVGQYKDNLTREKGDVLDDLKRQLEAGSISSQGSNDCLTMALGNPEHVGRVRGVGQFVTPTEFFNLSFRDKKCQNSTEPNVNDSTQPNNDGDELRMIIQSQKVQIQKLEAELAAAQSRVHLPTMWPTDHNDILASKYIQEFTVRFQNDYLPDHTWSIQFPKIIFGKPVSCIITHSDVMDVCNRSETTMGVMNLFMSYLKVMLVDTHTYESIHFADSQAISGDYNYDPINGTNLEECLMHCLVSSSILFLPLLNDVHWIMIAIDITTKTVYVYDPLHHDIKPTIRKFIGKAFGAVFDGKKSYKLRHKKCPMHLDSHSCGYFVMRYMLELARMFVGNHSFDAVSDGLKDKIAYSDDEVDEIRRLWIEKLEEYM